MNKEFDYVICGAGLSGLMLIKKMFDDEFFTEKKILLLDNDFTHKHHKTWCFWESKNSYWDDYIYKSWDTIIFKTSDYKNDYCLNNYRYKMIQSKSFFDKIINKIKLSDNIFCLEASVLNFKESDDKVCIDIGSDKFYAKFFFNSSLELNKIKNLNNFDFLLQHFKGWRIKTKKKFFDKEKATIMDFSVEQKNATIFFYVLPFSENEALIEYTLFSKEVLNDKDYDAALKNYIKNIGIDDYSIIDTEIGSIPMTAFPFEKNNSTRIIHIGTAGGWTRPSTGYTFKFIEKNTGKLLNHIKTVDYKRIISFRNRHWIYDLIFLNVLCNHNIGKDLFFKLFSKNKIDDIFSFLDSDSTFLSELRIFSSFPIFIFIKASIKNFRKIIFNL